MKYITQSGRSMVETIGVLAVMGVLTIGGIAGYNYGINKHRANQVLQDIRLIYQETKYPNTVRQIVDTGSFPDMEVDTQSSYEYSFTFPDLKDFIYDSSTETTPNLISVNVTGVSKTACDILLKTKPEYVLMLKANGETTWNCTQDENELSYIFEITTDKLEYGKCTVCTGEHCFDDDLNCPEGEYCQNDVCSRCARGYTENTSGQCTSCSFSRKLDLTQENCHRCGDMMFGSDPSAGEATNCYSCNNVYLRTTQEYCQRCIDKDENVMFLGIDCINCKTRFIHTQNTTKENCFKCAEIKGQNGTQYSENVIWNEKMGSYSGLCISCYDYGAVANDDKTECVCPNGKFWGLLGGWWVDLPRCFSCEDTETRPSTINACNQCPNRYYKKYHDANIQCILCPEGQIKSADGKSCVDKPAE